MSAKLRQMSPEELRQVFKKQSRMQLLYIIQSKDVAIEVLEDIIKHSQKPPNQEGVMAKPKDNMEWLVGKIELKLRMFLKTKDISYLEKANDVLEELRDEHWLFGGKPPKPKGGSHANG